MERRPAMLLALSLVVALPAGEAAAASTRQETFVANGPAGITGGNSETLLANHRVTGAIQAIVPHPTDANVLWVGAANGGVWKTNNALSVDVGDSGGPTWTPLTDHMPGLAITSLEMDPTDASHDTLVAGVGISSSFGGITGKLTGILRTTDGGSSWTALGGADLTGKSVRDVAPRGSTIVVVAANGIWRSTDTGASFQLLSGDAASGLPAGSTFDLAGDPSDPDRLYTGVVGTGGGVYTSSDRGQTWQARGGGTFGGAASSDVLADADQVQLSVHADASAGTNAVYAAVLQDGLTHMFRSEDHGQNWQEIDAPADVVASGRSLMALVADPSHAHVVYLSGRHKDLGPEDYYRCNTTQPAGSQCTLINGSGTANNTSPHVDSRDMEFNAAGQLLEGDDGGLFLRTLPDSTGGDWFSIIGNLATTEDHSCAYDRFSHVGLCGLQDIGTPEQPGPGEQTWVEVQDDDGGAVTIADWDVVSTRYYSAWPGAPRLLRFTRAVCITGNFCIRVEPALNVEGTGHSLNEDCDDDDTDPGNDCYDPGIGTFPYVPIAAGSVPDPTYPQRLVIATQDRLYESKDGGENLSLVGGLLGKAWSVAYGGYAGTTSKPDVLYVGTDQGLFVRTGSGSTVTQTAYAGAVPRSLDLDPSNWQSAWVAAFTAIWHTTDHGATWAKVTGDLAAAGAESFRSVRMVPGADASVVVVGASDGVYATDADNPGRWARLSGALPNVAAYTLDYDAGDDVLLVGTMGRSTWLLPDASTINHRPLADPGGPYTTLEGQDVVLDGTLSSDPDTAKGDSVEGYDWDLDGDGTFGASGPTPSYTSVGQDGAFTVTLRASDQLGAQKTQSTTVTVQNVAPTLTLAPPAPIVENTPATVSGQLTDPGWEDPLTVTIDFGSGPVAVPGHYTSTPHGLARLTFSAQHVYGDNGTFPVQVCGSDDDTTVCSTVNVVVANVKPGAHIDPSTLPVVNGAVIAHEGDLLHFRGLSFDPGSDDRLTRWDFGDGTVVASMSFNNGVSPDPPQSPQVNPRTVVDLKDHAYTACLYTVHFSAADDDGGLSPVDAINVVIQGNADRAEDNGFWKKQYDGSGHADFDAARLACYLAIANYMSAVFSEARNAADAPAAFLVLKPDPQTDPRIQDFDRELLTAWLNFANGGVNLTESVVVNGHTTLTFADEMAQAETLRLDPAATKQDLDAHKAILEQFNHFKR